MMNYELFHVILSPADTSSFARMIFNRAVRSARLAESEYVREDMETGFDSAVLVLKHLS